MSRPRKPGNKDLPSGLHRDHAGRFYVVHPVSLRKAFLGTKDKHAALTFFRHVQTDWGSEAAEAKAEKIASRVKNVKLSTNPTLTDYCASFRKEKLPTLTKKNGKPLSKKTRDDYGRMLKNQVENSALLVIPVANVKPSLLRKYLASWLDAPSHYNYQKAVLSRVMHSAIDDGLIETNPVSAIVNRPVTARTVYMSDDHYISITGNLEAWQAKACDLLYMISHRPSDVLLLKEDQIVNNEVRFTARKNDVDMVIEMNTDLAEIVGWFKKWKTELKITSPYLIVYPPYSRRSSIGKPISVGYLSRKFAAAVIAAGLEPGTYALRDIRPKGLTDEYLIAGDSDKGGHLTDAMKRRYRRVRLPMRAKNNLRTIWER
jgi:hypothetical protein